MSCDWVLIANSAARLSDRPIRKSACGVTSDFNAVNHHFYAFFHIIYLDTSRHSDRCYPGLNDLLLHGFSLAPI